MKKINLQNYLTTNLKSDLLLYLIGQTISADLFESMRGTKSGVINRGDLFECYITSAPLNNSGLHAQSKGDYIYKGAPVEIKYITSKSAVDIQLQGTICEKYIIGFGYSDKIEIRLINKKDLIIDGKRIKLKDNKDKGIILKVITK